MAVVEFVADVYPYCKGDVMDLSADELKKVDATAKRRDITAYKAVKGAEDKTSASKADKKDEDKK